MSKDPHLGLFFSLSLLLQFEVHSGEKIHGHITSNYSKSLAIFIQGCLIINISSEQVFQKVILIDWIENIFPTFY